MMTLDSKDFRDSLAEMFHTGWRKATDSKASSMAWNLIYLLPRPVWGDFLDHLHAKLVESGAITAFNLKQACLSWEDRGMKHEPKFKETQRPHARLWKIMLEMTDSDDWFRLASWMAYCWREVNSEEGDEVEEEEVKKDGWDVNRLQYLSQDRIGVWSFVLNSIDDVPLAILEGRWSRSLDGYRWTAHIEGKDKSEAVEDANAGIALIVKEVSREFRLAREMFDDSGKPKEGAEASSEKK